MKRVDLETISVHEIDSGNSNNSVDVEVPIDSNRLLLEGVAETCTNEMINLYITLIFNSNLDDSFRVEEMRRNRRKVMLKFNRVFNFDEINARQKKLSELGGSTISFHRVRVPDTIRVSDLNNMCTRELLDLYFSNTKVSSGGEIKSIKMYSHESKALVQFRNYSKIQDVLSRSHVIAESLVKLEKYYGPIEDEFIREEEELDADLASSESSTTSRGMNKRKPQAQISRTNLLNAQAIDKTKLVMSNIQENVSIQQIDFLVKLITGKNEINEINWSLEHKGKILIDFKREVDVHRLIEDFQLSPALSNLNGKAVQLETVQVTRTIVVLVKDFKLAKKPTTPQMAKLDSVNDEEEYKPESIPASRDLLDLYFINKQRSGGGEVESIERKSSRYWLVIMKDHRCLKDILSRRHVIDEKPIKVFPYYSNFGLPYIFRPLFDDYHSSSSAAFKLKIKDDRLRYFCKVKTLHKKLNDILSESNAVSRYNKLESNIIYVNYLEKLETRVPYTERMWRLKVKESIEYFLHIYKYEKITLSHNQWTAINRNNQLGDNFLQKSSSGGSRDEDEQTLDENAADGDSATKVKYIGNNCAIVSVNETSNNTEISLVGPINEVEKFIVKIKDIICKAYFTFELEEKIIKFKTYLYECEDLLAKWLNDSQDGGYDSDTEQTLMSARLNDSFESSRRGAGDFKLNKSRRNTIDEFISKLERDHLDMELSYGKLFQELGYTFLTNVPQEAFDDDDHAEYKDFNDRLTSGLDETITPRANESQMDKIKYTLDDLRSRITEMRKKFKQFLVKMKKTSKSSGGFRQGGAGGGADLSDDLDEDNLDDENEDENEDLFKLCVYVKEQKKIVTFKIHKRCRVRELKQILLEKIADQTVNTIDEIKLTYNNVEMSNDGYTINDYGIGDKATITLEFRHLED
jgi:hypothetical protein